MALHKKRKLLPKKLGNRKKEAPQGKKEERKASILATGVNTTGRKKNAGNTKKDLRYITCYNYDKKRHHITKCPKLLKK